jgi:hypothetical protein
VTENLHDRAAYPDSGKDGEVNPSKLAVEAMSKDNEYRNQGHGDIDNQLRDGDVFPR